MRILAVTFIFLFSGPSLFSQQPPPKTSASLRKPASLAAGGVVNNIYDNPELAITYKILLGWVDRTDQSKGQPDNSGGQVLLAAFEHPPEVKGEGINSAVGIAAEPPSSFPGVKPAADYFRALTEAATSQGLKVTNEPYETTVGSKSLVRSDFSKESGKTTMYQSSLVTL